MKGHWLTQQQFGEIGGFYIVIIHNWCCGCYEAHQCWHEEVQVIGLHLPTMIHSYTKKHKQYNGHKHSNIQNVCWNPRIGDDSLGDLAHVHKQQCEGEDPAQVVARKVQPGVMMDLHLWALATPAWTQTHTCVIILFSCVSNIRYS